MSNHVITVDQIIRYSYIYYKINTRISAKNHNTQINNNASLWVRSAKESPSLYALFVISRKYIENESILSINFTTITNPVKSNYIYIEK